MLPFVRNLMLQPGKEHLYGFSSLWILMWTMRLVMSLNLFPHPLIWHLYFLLVDPSYEPICAEVFLRLSDSSLASSLELYRLPGFPRSLQIFEALFWTFSLRLRWQFPPSVCEVSMFCCVKWSISELVYRFLFYCRWARYRWMIPIKMIEFWNENRIIQTIQPYFYLSWD